MSLPLQRGSYRCVIVEAVPGREWLLWIYHPGVVVHDFVSHRLFNDEFEDILVSVVMGFFSNREIREEIQVLVKIQIAGLPNIVSIPFKDGVVAVRELSQEQNDSRNSREGK